uniref:Putative methyltransferase n=1 Tax=viral metagenome TaxID=1070528 RepID=A0A6M3IRM9_9ZZZZ
MKLLDAIKEKGNPYWIPDCVRSDLPDFFKELGFKVGAEIGVSLGYNLELYLKAGFKMYGIDQWEDYEDEKYRPINALSKKGIVTETFDDVYKLAIERLSPYSNCILIKKKSMDALVDVPDRSLDFVYIDGNHMYGYVAMDLMQWAKKVRKGGIIAGHDYYDIKGSRSNRGVRYAVDGFMKSYDIDNFYVLGRKHIYKGQRSERALSFFCFKHW